MVTDVKIYGGEKKLPALMRTMDYSMFRRMEGNREVTAKRARNIRNSIEQVGLIPSPIIVNEHMEVIDGQGRLEAIRQLGLPVFYIIVPGLTLADCVAMNVNTTPWTLLDYISSYAETGNDSYRRLLNLINSYDLPMSTVVCAATGVMATSNASVIKNGTLNIDGDFYWAIDGMLSYIERFSKLMKEAGISNRGPVLSCLCFCYQCDDVDNERMYDQFMRYCHKLTSATKTLEILDTLSDIYNFGRKKSRVYIKTKYLEYLDGKYPWYSAYWGKRARNSEGQEDSDE